MIKTVFMGTPNFSIESLRYLKENTDLSLVITKEDKINSRGKKIIYSAVKQYAIDNNIEYIQPKSIKTQELYNILKEINPDLIVVAAYGKIIPKSIIDLPRLGVINVHSSILPKYRGASPIQAALMNGDKKTGISIMMIDEGLDTGDVLGIFETDIDENENYETLTKKLASVSYMALEKIVPKLVSNTAIRQKQDDSKASEVRPITKEETQIDWNNTNEKIHNLIRALSPSPASYTTLNKSRIKIYESQKIDKEYEGINGEVVELSKNGPIIKCGKGSLCISKLKLEGKAMQSGRDVLNGRKIKLGDLMEYE